MTHAEELNMTHLGLVIDNHTVSHSRQSACIALQLVTLLPLVGSKGMLPSALRKCNLMTPTACMSSL